MEMKLEDKEEYEDRREGKSRQGERYKGRYKRAGQRWGCLLAALARILMGRVVLAVPCRCVAATPRGQGSYASQRCGPALGLDPVDTIPPIAPLCCIDNLLGQGRKASHPF
jgi:hypothetical protein